MADISVRRERALAEPEWSWDPFRTFRQMMRWDPFVEFFGPHRGEKRGFSPDFDVRETKDGIVIEADLPGVKEDDLEITVSGSRLTVRGKRETEREEKDETYYTYERSYGGFSRSFTCPEGIDTDKVKAELKSGVLTLTMPKSPELQARRIELKPARAKG